jgi:hypothetical protein
VTVSSELPTGVNVLNGRFVVTIKDVGTEKEIYKARYVVQGHRDKEKTSMVHHMLDIRCCALLTGQKPKSQNMHMTTCMIDI